MPAKNVVFPCFTMQLAVSIFASVAQAEGFKYQYEMLGENGEHFYLSFHDYEVITDILGSPVLVDPFYPGPNGKRFSLTFTDVPTIDGSTHSLPYITGGWSGKDKTMTIALTGGNDRDDITWFFEKRSTPLPNPSTFNMPGWDLFTYRSLQHTSSFEEVYHFGNIVSIRSIPEPSALSLVYILGLFLCGVMRRWTTF